VLVGAWPHRGRRSCSPAKALVYNTEGSSNTADGFEALFSNTTGVGNVASGYTALYSNTGGVGNIATGDSALLSNTAGDDNVANGVEALAANTTGGHNTASGIFALGHNTTGYDNIGLGDAGGNDLTTGSYNVDIANEGVAGESDTTRIGALQTRTFVAGIYSVEAPSGSKTCTVKVTAEGQLVCKVAKKDAGPNEPALVAEVGRQQQQINTLVSEVEALQKR
jgi:hypothetical protein